MFRVAICVILFAWVSSVSAQIIYEPIQYQYRSGDTTYYYGGSNRLVHFYAQEPVNPHRQVSTKPYRIYMDQWNRGLRDVRILGFTPADVQNQANANAPQYFVKSELLRAAAKIDGVWVVPAQAGAGCGCKNPRLEVMRPPAPLRFPRPLMIIPKDALEKPPRSSDKLLVCAG